MLAAPLHQKATPEVLVEKVDVPRRLKQGEPFDLKRKLNKDPETDGDGCRIEQCEESRPIHLRRPRPLHQMHRQAAQSPSEQRHGDHHEREVVPDRGGIDACESNFEDQPRKSDEKDAGAR